MQYDYTFMLIWFGVPIAILFGRAAWTGYKTKKKKQELLALEENITPITRRI